MIYVAVAQGITSPYGTDTVAWLLDCAENTMRDLDDTLSGAAAHMQTVGTAHNQFL